MKNKTLSIFLNVIPLLLMIGLIPPIKNDYILSIIYIAIIAASLAIKYEEKDSFFLIFGIIIMTASEYIFISTGAETFNRNTLFGIMPIWLPILWGYAFVAIKRTIKIIGAK